MKICIVAPRPVYPNTSGDTLRLIHLCKYLKQHGHSIIYISYFSGEKEPFDSLDLFEKCFYLKQKKITTYFYSLIRLLGNKPIQTGYFYSKDYKSRVKEVIKDYNPDLFICHTIRMIPYFEELNIRENCIVEMSDALSRTYKLANISKSRNIKKFLYRIEYRRIKRYEQLVIRKYPKVILVSEADKKYLGNSDNICVYPNGVDVNKTKKTYDKDKIVFLGNMRTLQNQDAALFFAKDVFPLIKKVRDKAKFYIVGAQPNNTIKRLNDGSDVIVTGFVESAEEYIRDSCLVVAPIRIAAGIQNKILVAMANGIPVVTTSLMKNGIPELETFKNCMIADDAESFALRCLELINDDIIRNSIANSGFCLVQENYNWNKMLMGYEIL